MGAAASARMHTVLDSSGTRLKKKKKSIQETKTYNSNDRIKVQTVSGCTAFLSGYSLHQETGEIGNLGCRTLQYWN